MTADTFVCRNCGFGTSTETCEDPWEAAQEHADDEDHIVDVRTVMSTVIPQDVMT